MKIAAVAFGKAGIGEREAETVREQGRHRVFVSSKAEPVDAAGPQYETVSIVLHAVEQGERLPPKAAVSEARAIRGKGIAADIRSISDDIAAVNPSAIADEIAHFGP